MSDSIAVLRPNGSGTTIYYIHSDELNTPRAITNTNNLLVWKWESDAFGRGAAKEDPSATGTNFVMNLRFPGQYFDKESGMHYNYHRDYDPSTGRYIQSDPIGLLGGINTYTYVGGNPLYYIDPLGLSERDVGLIHNAFNRYIEDATRNGDRTSPGAWNNLNRSLFDLTGGEAGNNYKGCWEQSNDLKDKLKNLKLDDKWDFDRIDRGWRPTPHSWIEGSSSNPNDPHITADPWNDSFFVKY